MRDIKLTVIEFVRKKIKCANLMCQSMIYGQYCLWEEVEEVIE